MENKALAVFEEGESSRVSMEGEEAIFATPIRMLPPSVADKGKKPATKKTAKPRPSRSKYLHKKLQGGGGKLGKNEVYVGSVISPSGNVSHHSYVSRVTLDSTPRGNGQGMPLPSEASKAPRQAPPRRPAEKHPTKLVPCDLEDDEPPVPTGPTLGLVNTRINAMRVANCRLQDQVAELVLENGRLRDAMDSTRTRLLFKIRKLAKSLGKESVIDPKA